MKYRVVVEEEVVVAWYHEVDADSPEQAVEKAKQGDGASRLGEVYGSDGSEGRGPDWDYAEIYQLEDENV